QRGEHGLGQEVVDHRRARIDEQHHEDAQHGRHGPQQARAQFDQVGDERVLGRGVGSVCHAVLQWLVSVVAGPEAGAGSDAGSAGRSAAGAGAVEEASAAEADAAASPWADVSGSSACRAWFRVSWIACEGWDTAGLRSSTEEVMEDCTERAASSIWCLMSPISFRSISFWISDLTSLTSRWARPSRCPTVRASLGRRSGPMTISAITPISISSLKLTSNTAGPVRGGRDQASVFSRAWTSTVSALPACCVTAGLAGGSSCAAFMPFLRPLT